MMMRANHESLSGPALATGEFHDRENRRLAPSRSENAVRTVHNVRVSGR